MYCNYTMQANNNKPKTDTARKLLPLGSTPEDGGFIPALFRETTGTG